MAYMVLALERAEIQLVAGKQQHGARNRRLGYRHFIEILKRSDLGAGDYTLERGVITLDARYKLGDFIVLRNSLRRNLFVFTVKTAYKADFAQNFLRRTTREVKDAVFLANPCCKHGVSFDLILTLSTDPTPGRWSLPPMPMIYEISALRPTRELKINRTAVVASLRGYD